MVNRYLNVIRAQRDLVYRFDTAETEKVGRLARFLSQQDSVLETGTLEIARLINNLDVPLTSLNLQPGDRLVLLDSTEEHASDQITMDASYKMLYFRSSSVEITSGGKKSLVLGRSDKGHSPDVDLALFVLPEDLSASAHVSRRCIEMKFDSDSKCWTLERVGNPEVMINERFLGVNETIIVDRIFQLRFFHEKRLIGAIEVDMQSVDADTSQTRLQDGNFPVQVRVALEKSNIWLNVTDTLPLHKIVEGLQYHWGLDEQQSLYLMQLALPDTELKALPNNAARDTFLYSGKRFKSAFNLLRLSNMLKPERNFERKANSGQVNIAIGLASTEGTNPRKIDLNLHEEMSELGQALMTRLNKIIANINYRESDGTWWLTPEDRNPLSIFINNDHLQSGNSHQLDTDDVITFGQSISNYYCRLQVVLDTSAN